MNQVKRNASIVGLFLLAAAVPLAAQQDGEQTGAVVAEEVVTGAAEGTGAEPSTMETIVEKSKELMEAGADTAKKGWDKTKEVSGDVWEGTKDVSGEAWDKTKEVSGKAVDATKKTAAKVGAATKAGYEAAKEAYVSEGESEADGTAAIDAASEAAPE